MNPFLEAVAMGIGAKAEHQPTSLMITYSNGVTLTFDGEAVLAWFSAYISLMNLAQSVMNASDTPAVPSEQVRKHFKNEKE